MKAKGAKRQGPGRPKHADKPYPFFTTIPTSVHELLCDLSEVQHRTKSEILTDALRAYARRFSDQLKHI